MRRHVPRRSAQTPSPVNPADPVGLHTLRRLLTAAEVAGIVGCHEETVRRAYLCGQLRCQRFGVRSWRFHLADVEDWFSRGAPTRPTTGRQVATDGPS
jgi:excisionase family DNA binding protein